MATDPWYWTETQVADFFRDGAASLVGDMAHARLPDIPSFAQLLLENNVSGHILLSGAVDAQFLKEDCSIRSLGMRSAIMHCISKLKSQFPFPSTGGDDNSKPHTPVPSPVAPPQNASSANRPPTPVPVFDPIGENIRSGEIQVQDERGRKRRKLDLSISQPAPKPKPEQALQVVGFLSDKGLPVDEIFYGKAQLGEEIGKMKPQFDGVIDGPGVDGFEVFQFHDLRRPVGDVSYVHKQVQYFLKNETFVPLKRRGRAAIAVLPYREDLAGKKVQSATVYQMRPGTEDEVIAIREKASLLDSDFDYNGLPQDETGEWDFLNEKYRPAIEEEVLPKYGASDYTASEISSTLAREISEEEHERELLRSAVLSKQEASEAVDECINKYVLEWEAKLPRLQNKARSVWKKMKNSRTLRTELIEGTKSRIGSLSKRLEKQKEELLLSQWENESTLTGMCEIMRVSVDDRELCKWKISVWESKQEPHHEVRHRDLSKSISKHAAVANAGLTIHPDDRFTAEPADALADAGHEQERDASPGNQEAELTEGGDGDVEDEMDVDPPPAPLDNFIEDASPHLIQVPVNGSLSHPDPRSPHFVSKQSSAAETNNLSSLLPSSSGLERSQQLKKPRRSDVSSMANPIEISSDSNPSPVIKVRRSKKAERDDEAAWSANPRDANVSEVNSWGFHELVARQDRTRLLIKLLSQMGEHRRTLVQQHITKLRKPKFAKLLESTVDVLRKSFSERGEHEENQVMIQTTRIYLAYSFLRPDLATAGPDVLPDATMWEELSDIGALTFTRLLDDILSKTLSKLFVRPVSKPAKLSDIHHISSDTEDDDTVKSSPGMKRLKMKQRPIVQQSQAHQNQAFKRQERFQAVQIQYSNSQERIAMVQEIASRSSIQINLLKDDDDEPIYVDQRIARKMKDHQAAGVQFIWREFTADAGDGAQGCILAHTMGLGKTMQTISFLVALNEAARSANPAVYKQLPEQLRPKERKVRQLRILVLCPPALIQNWKREINEWASEKLPNVFSVESSEKPVVQMNMIESWYAFGGILILGFENFRNRVIGFGKDFKGAEPGTDIYKYLVEGPELVVADEAHKLKDEKSGVSKAARKIKTQSRLALTGTPMSNDVQEIYALVSWVAPDYLGDSQWFNANFARPIKEGNGKDSTAQQVRRGIKKLAVLHRQIEPKVNRADINVLRGSLRAKVEYVMTVPLLESQTPAYKKYVAALLSDRSNDNATQVAMFGWLSVLTLLVNHPLAFKRKLLSPAIARKPRQKSGDWTPIALESGNSTPVALESGHSTPNPERGEEDEVEVAVRTLGFSDEVIQDITESISDDIDHTLSAKMTILMEIVDLSKKCGDKLLVFSHSIPTLDYVGQLFRKAGVRFGRIDGQVPANKREAIIAEFETGEANVLTVSTRAGNVGLNIQGANRVVIIDFSFNPSYEAQAIGRAYRLGQTKPVFVYRFVVGGTFETNIYNKQVFKTSLSSRVVDKKSTKRIADWNTRSYLYNPHEVVQEDLTPSLEENGEARKDDAVLYPMLKRHLSDRQIGCGASLIRSLVTMETLQEEVKDAPLTEEERKEVDEEFEFGRNTRAAKAKRGLVPPPSTAPSASAYGTLSQRQPPRAIMAPPPGTAPSAQTVHPGSTQNGAANRPSLRVILPHGLPLSSHRPQQD